MTRNYETTLDGTLYILSSRKTLYEYSNILEEILPEIYLMLVNEGYDPKQDKNINGAKGGIINNHNLALKLLKLD